MRDYLKNLLNIKSYVTINSAKRKKGEIKKMICCHLKELKSDKQIVFKSGEKIGEAKIYLKEVINSSELLLIGYINTSGIIILNETSYYKLLKPFFECWDFLRHSVFKF